MFQKEITLFNYLYSEDDYSKTLIKNVEIQPVYRTFPDTTDTQNLGSVLIIIPYKKDLGGVYVNEGNDKKILFKA